MRAGHLEMALRRRCYETRLGRSLAGPVAPDGQVSVIALLRSASALEWVALKEKVARVELEVDEAGRGDPW